MTVGVLVPLLFASSLPTSGIEFFGSPSELRVDERGKATEYLILRAGSPVRASIKGPGTLTIEVRGALRRSEKKKTFAIRVVADAVEIDTFAVNVTKASKTKKPRFKGKGAPRGTRPSAAQRLTVEVEAGEYFYEFHLGGTEKVAFIALELGPSEAVPAGAALLPDGDMGLPPLPDAGLPPLDEEPPPRSAMPGPAGPPTAEPHLDRVQFFGTPAETVVEEMGEVKSYRSLTAEQPLRAEIQGPGALMFEVRVPVRQASKLHPLTLAITVDGVPAPSHTLEPRAAPDFTKTIWKSGGLKGTEPSAAEWFTIDVGPGTSFFEISLQTTKPHGQQTACLSLDLTPTAAPAPAVAEGPPEENPPTPEGSEELEEIAEEEPLLSRKELEALQESAEASVVLETVTIRGWRFVLELAGGGTFLLAKSDPGYCGRVGVQVTPPWLDGWLGLSLSGGYRAAGDATAWTVELPRASAGIEINRTRHFVPLELGIHVLWRVTDRIRLQAEGGGGYYFINLYTEALSRQKHAVGQRLGLWAGLRFGVMLGPGMLFAAGRFAAPEAMPTKGGMVDTRSVIAELGYALTLTTDQTEVVEKAKAPAGAAP